MPLLAAGRHWQGDESIDTGYVNDTTRFRSGHQRQKRLASMHHTPVIDVKYPPHIVERDVFKEPPKRYPRIVEQQINRAMFGTHLLGKPLHS